MYLCRFAAAVNAAIPQQQQIDPAAMIMKFMPLKADRVLPGPLLKTMKEHGFVELTRVPKIFKSMAVPNAVCPEHVPQNFPPTPPPELQQEALATGKNEQDVLYEAGEQVVYWSDTMGQWVDAVVLGLCFAPNGALIGYDLDVKQMANVDKMRRKSQRTDKPAMSSSRQQAPLDHPGPSASQSAAPSGSNALPCSDAASLSAHIAAAVREGWFSMADVEAAMKASLVRNGDEDSVQDPLHTCPRNRSESSSSVNSTVAL